MASKIKKDTKTKTKKKISKEPTSSSVLKKISTVTDSTKILSKEIKSMTKIFAENQKILVSMKNMIDTLSGTSRLMKKLFEDGYV